MVQTDDNVFLCLGDWSGGYNTEILSDSDDEVENWGGWLIEDEETVLIIVGIFLAFTWWHKRNVIDWFIIAFE